MNAETVRNLSKIGIDARRTFSFPHELIDDPSLNFSQKREILAEWASDACAIESFPTLRLLPGTTFPVTLSSIMDALTSLDDTCGSPGESVRAPRRVRNESGSKRRRPREPHAISQTWRANAAHDHRVADHACAGSGTSANRKCIILPTSRS
jgi:hypothetical protein